jgi:hypothetical protein
MLNGNSKNIQQVTWAGAHRWWEEAAPWNGPKSVEGLITTMWKARNNQECFLLCILVTPHIAQQPSSLMNLHVCLVHFVYS